MGHILLVRSDAGETVGVAPSALETAGASTVIWEALEGEPRPSLDGVSGVVLFGSSSNVEHANEHGFIKDARELTLEAIDRGEPYLCICFGAQLLAWSLDAEVTKAPVREIGFEPIRPAAAAGDPLLSHYADGDYVFQWLDMFERAAGPLERSWSKAAGRVREEAVRRLADHESNGREVFTRFAGLAASAP